MEDDEGGGVVGAFVPFAVAVARALYAPPSADYRAELVAPHFDATVRVLNVTSPTPDGVYAPGDSIDVVVEFSEFVAVSGTPFVNLETGIIDRTAMYVGGSGTRFLKFRYDIQPGDISYDLDFVDAHSLERGFDITGAVGSILMMSTNPAVAADIDLALVGAAGSLSNNSALIVDGATPYITGLDIDADDGSSFTLGDRVPVVVRFSAAVSVSFHPAGASLSSKRRLSPQPSSSGVMRSETFTLPSK